MIINNQFNSAYYCTQYQCEIGNKDKIAFVWIDSNKRYEFTFNDLNIESNIFANILRKLNIQKGDTVFTFLPKIPEIFFSFLGTLKNQSIICPLFSNFGDDSLFDRLIDSNVKLLVTKKSLLKKVLRIKDKISTLKYILVVDIDDDIDNMILSLPSLHKTVDSIFNIEITLSNTPSILHYTSGSTGKPKGVLHVHKSILLQSYTTKNILQLKDDDKYWCTADQGWITGTAYGIFGPWCHGITQIHYSGVYNIYKWMEIIEKEQITSWFTSPTALRMLMRTDKESLTKYNFKNLKYIFSAGEPLNPEIVLWSRDIFNLDIYDIWFQTECGSIMICNKPGDNIKLGSMGKPIDIIESEIISDDGLILEANQIGNLCLKEGWDSMFIGYLNHPDIYESKFKNGYYYSGDIAYKDSDGFIFFVGRNDDVINIAGHLISPFEIESVLLEIDEISESAVIGVPDDLLFEKSVAYISLNKPYVFNDDLKIKINLILSNKLSSIAIPKDIIVIDEIPKNNSGKIMRRIIKSWYLNEDPGDISTLK